MLGAVVHPHHAVLPLLRGHFCGRLPDENFMIYDATHGMALMQKDGQVQYLRMQRYAPAPEALDEDEKAWRALWKRFLKR